MLKKVLLTIVVAVVAVVAGGFLFRDLLIEQLIASQIRPEADFDPATVPAAPDYASTTAWAALPELADAADDLPQGAAATDFTPLAKMFFVHPTTYMGRANWNQPLTDEAANWIVEQRVLRHQASVFNDCCEIYAPRYRQATFYSFLDNSGSGEKALDLAYQDVRNAFATFLEQLKPGEPFILAGHSQGTAHATRLLREEIAGTPLQQQLIAAYLVGFSISADQLGGIPVCKDPAQTGCAVGWNTVSDDGAGLFNDADLICVNPLSWRADGKTAGSELNLGGIGYPSWGPVDNEIDVDAMQVEPAAADARCAGGNLIVSELNSTAFPSRMPGNSMHIYDYSLFHLNIRANARQRVEAYRSGG